MSREEYQRAAHREEIETALAFSTDCLRQAAQSLEINGYPVMADMLRKQVDQNMAILLPPESG